MRRQGARRPAVFALLGYLVLFLTVSAVVTLALFVYSATTEAFAENKAAISGFMFVVIFFCATVCTVIDGIRRKLTVERPVESILEATGRIAAGDFSVRLNTFHPYGRYNEYDCIIADLNKMAAQLSRSHMMRSDFLSNVSHELKTPVAVIGNYSAALKRGVDEETQQRYLSVIGEAAARMGDLVSNILRLTRLENREGGVEHSKVRLEESVAQAVLQFEDRIEEKGLALECDLDEVSILSDAGYLEIVWNNLISNAIKFTEAGGSVFLSLKREGEDAVVTVRDTGCGMSRETGARIFEKFYQGDTSHAKEGSGLGLALVKKVIEVLGGEIAVESEPGRGSTFTVRLRGADA